MKPSCVIIGEGTLPLRCAQLWLAAGHDIVALVTDDPDLLSWARINQISTVRPDADLVGYFSTHPFDYLFSIVNDTILPAQLLQLPTELAINYHDGPLPRYAGTHATAWAILNGETEHGISWHEMTAQVDAGDIFVQKKVPILPDDTTLMLNVRCYDVAVAAFEQLIADLAAGSLSPRKQDQSARTFFGRNKSLPNAGILDWRQSAQALSRLVRATQMEPYPNRLGVPRLWTGSDWFVVSGLKISGSIRVAPTGSVVGVGDDWLEIVIGDSDSAETQTVIVSGLRTLEGQPTDLAAFSVGDRLPLLSEFELQALEKANRRALSHESKWVQRLQTRQPAVLPYYRPPATAAVPVDNRQALPAGIVRLLAQFADRDQDALLTLMLCYLARINEAGQVAIGLISAENDVPHTLFSPVVPFAPAIELQHEFSTILSAVSDYRAQSDRHFTFNRDIFVRYPALSWQPWPISVSFEPSHIPDPDAVLLHIAVDLSNQAWHWHYVSSTLTETDVRLIVSVLDAFAEDMLAQPRRAAAVQSLLSATDRQRMYVDWNATSAPATKQVLLHKWFEKQALQSPEAIAIRAEDQDLTYAELDRRANELAHGLTINGVLPGAFVAICLERSAELVIALLAVLKAGAAYVPLDPAYPQERLQFMLGDCAASVLIAHSNLGVSIESTATKIYLDEIAGTPTSLPTTAPEIEVATEGSAYLLYTSGSTGRPKGVVISHSAIVNHMCWFLRQFSVTAEDVVLQKTPFSFDASIWEFYAPLLCGGTLVLARPDGHRDPIYLTQAIQEHAVTLLQLVPTQLRMLLETPGFSACTTLRHVFCGGEPLSAEWVNQFHAAQQASLTNLYGPSECTIDTTFHTFSRDEQRDPVPIGRPIDNVQLVVVDSFDQPVPVGVAGELLISGAGVGSGYWNRPKLSAERFVPLASMPWSAELPSSNHDMLYRSGDRVRWQADGTLVFLGRADDQIKLRGHRIELGEIEAALDSLKAVVTAVARVDISQPAAQLVAYVVSAESSLNTQQLREDLLGLLPEYMVPSVFVVMDQLPVMPNGKVDRRALPAPDMTRQLIASEQPHDEIEAMLATLWCQLLAVAAVGRHDSFFSVGGDSLFAARLAGRIQDVFGVPWSINDQFSAPTIAETAALIRTLRPGETVKLPPISQPVMQAPLNDAQLRLWLLMAIHDVDPAYNVSIALQLNGDLNVDALQDGLQWLVARHPALRTVIRANGGEPEQVVLPTVLFRLARETVSAESPLALRLTEQARQPFDLASAPLLRATLFQLASDQHVLQMTQHHIITDGWSNRILLHDLNVAYTAFATGKQPELPELTSDYATYTLRQNALLESDALESARQYWLRRFSAETTPLNLPIDRPRPQIQTFEGSTFTTRLSGDLLDAVHGEAAKAAVTPFMWLLTLYYVLLARRTRQSDIVVGVPSANRTDPDSEAIVGMFVNTLALRADLSGNPTFAALLAQVRDIVLTGTANQHFPFNRLVELVQPERDLRYSPLFQTWFALETAADSGLNLPGVTSAVLDVAHGTAKFDLSLYIEQRGDQWLAHWEYNTALFARESIERLAGQWQVLLAGALAAPETAIERLPLLDSAEKQTLLRDWNQTAVDYDSDVPLHRWIEAQAERTPDAPAVILPTESGEQRLTYADLDRRTNQLAHHLQTLGVAPEVIVGICLQRSAEMVIAIHAVVKAGGAYLPLEPTYPHERLALMIEDAKPPVILTHTSVQDRLPETEAQLIVLDGDKVWQQAPQHRPDNRVTPDNLAYVMYTSGSTGRPKGVLNTHRGIVNRLLWMQDTFQLNSSDVVLQKTPFSFDVSVWEFFWPLMTGATLVVARPDGHRDDAYLQHLIKTYGITTLHFVPSMLRSFLEQPGVAECRRLQRVICSGEALPLAVQERFFSLLDAELHNLYGPTEAAIDVSAWRCQRDDMRGIVPIGKPIANIQLYILDASLQPVPIGSPGELHIGGVGVARGYLNRPNLTEERFIPDPFSADPQARLYKTGDWVRFLSDGNIEFFGRMDAQVKIRGFRIELGEVEAILQSHPAISTAVVTLADQGDEPAQLVAYVVFYPDQRATVMEIRAFMSGIAPDFMIPAHFVWLDALPLTRNGKLNRRALPPPTETQLPLGSTFAAPHTASELLLVEIWEQVLDQTGIGIDDNFFALGGDSIRALQVIHAAQRHFAPIAVLDLFRQQTVRMLASTWQTHHSLPESDSQPQLALKPEFLPGHLAQAFEDAYPATAMQLQVLAAYENDADRIGVYHFQQVQRVEEALFSAETFQKAVDYQIACHPALRTTFWRSEEMVFQIVKSEQSVSVRPVDTDLTTAMRDDRLQPFDPFAGTPLFRMYLLRDSAETVSILISFHHAIIDGWSNIEFINALFDAYAALRRGEALLPPRSDRSMRDYALLEAEIKHDRAAQTFWRNQLAQLPAAAVPPHWSGAGVGNVVLSLEAELVRALQATARAHNVTVKTVFLSAYLRALRAELDRPAVAVGIVANGRSERLSNPLRALGLYWNIVPFGLAFDSAEDDALQRIHARLVAMEAYVRYPVGSEQTGSAPPFWATFNFVQFHNARQKTADGQIRYTTVAAFDKFHFPFNLTARLESRTQSADLRVEFDGKYVGRDAAQAIIDQVVRQLEQIAAKVQVQEE